MKIRTYFVIGIVFSLIFFCGCQSTTDKNASFLSEEYAGSIDDLSEQALNAEDRDILTDHISTDEALTICVDAGCKDSARQLVSAWERLNEGARAELIVIPEDTSAAETVISEMRTEILSGGGPDVFLLQCADPNAAEPMTVLFSDPEKMMYSDIFLPLDTFMEKAIYMNSEDLNQTILEAGKTQEGQMILPISYDYFVYVFPQEVLKSGDSIASWDNLMACEDPSVMSSVASRIFTQFYDASGNCMDYEDEIPVLSEQELLKLTEEAAAYQEKGWEYAVSDEAFGDVYSLSDGLFSELGKDNKNTHVIFGLPNTEGGITANITMYAAVNRNSKQPTMAFSLLDLLFSKEIASGIGFKEGDEYFGNLITFPEGFSIHNRVLEEGCSRLTAEDAKAVMQMNDRINAVRFHTDLDKEMNALFRAVSSTSDESERENDVSQTYHKIWMMLSE